MATTKLTHSLGYLASNRPSCARTTLSTRTRDFLRQFPMMLSAQLESSPFPPGGRRQMAEEAKPKRKFWQINLIGMEEESDSRLRAGAQMDRARKDAYRWLLYVAMLELRVLQLQLAQGSRWRFLNPFYLRRRAAGVRRSIAVTEALHNLAQFAATDFDGFNEVNFWKDIDSLTHHRTGWQSDYRMEFERRLSELRAEGEAEAGSSLPQK